MDDTALEMLGGVAFFFLVNVKGLNFWLNGPDKVLQVTCLM